MRQRGDLARIEAQPDVLSLGSHRKDGHLVSGRRARLKQLRTGALPQFDPQDSVRVAEGDDAGAANRSRRHRRGTGGVLAVPHDEPGLGGQPVDLVVVEGGEGGDLRGAPAPPHDLGLGQARRAHVAAPAQAEDAVQGPRHVRRVLPRPASRPVLVDHGVRPREELLRRLAVGPDHGGPRLP